MDDLFELIDEVEEVEDKKPAKKEASKKPAKKQEDNKSEEGKKVNKYKYPFVMYYAAQNIDVSHIFEEGKEYTSEEITNAMLNHQFYEFSGKVTYDFIESDNVLVPTFQQHKKG